MRPPPHVHAPRPPTPHPGQVIELLAAGTLATQTLVLAASLLQQPESQASAVAAAPVGPAASASAAAATALRPRGWLGALRQLLPADGTEARALAVLVLTRFVALPLATISALQALVAGAGGGSRVWAGSALCGAAGHAPTAGVLLAVSLKDCAA